MAYAQSIADIIRQEAAQRGNIGIEKAGLWPQAIGQSAAGLQGALNQIAQNRTRGLQDTALKQRIAAGDIDLSRAKREEEYQKRKEAAQRDAQQRATQATSQDEKLRILTEFAQQWEPKAYREMVEEARKQRESEANIEKTRAETKKLGEPPSGGTVVSPGGAFVPFGKEQPSFTNTQRSIGERDVKVGTKLSEDKKRNIAVFKRPDNTTYDIDLGPVDEKAAGGAEAGSYIPVVDNLGNLKGAWNPKSGRTAQLPKALEGTRRSSLTFDERRARTNARSGLRATATMREMLKDPNILAQAAVPGSPFARKFDSARKESIDVLTRLRTGAALNKEEEDFYAGQVPTLLDLTDPSAIEYKLGMLESIYNDLAAGGEDTVNPKAPKANKPKSDPLKLF